MRVRLRQIWGLWALIAALGAAAAPVSVAGPLGLTTVGQFRQPVHVYGDVCSGRLRSVRLGAGRAVGDRSEQAVVPYLVSFGRDGAGRIYAVSLVGRVYRVG